MKTEAGNALFLILIAVALFAALSYAVTQSSRGGTSIAREQAMIDTAVSQQCEAAVQTGIMRLEAIYGCSSDEISYQLPDGTNVNPENLTDRSCFLFDNEGAGVTPCGQFLEPAPYAVTFGNFEPDGNITFTLYNGEVGAHLRYDFSDEDSNYGTIPHPYTISSNIETITTLHPDAHMASGIVSFKVIVDFTDGTSGPLLELSVLKP